MGAVIVIAVTFGLLWLLFILPQQRRVRAHQQLVMSLEEGDEVVLTAGIYGRITSLGPEDLDLEVAPGVELRVARQAVLRRIEHLAPTDDVDDLTFDAPDDSDDVEDFEDQDDNDLAFHELDDSDVEDDDARDAGDDVEDDEEKADHPAEAAEANGAQIDSDDDRGNNARRRGGDITL